MKNMTHPKRQRGQLPLYDGGSQPKTYKLPTSHFDEVNHRIKLLLMEYQIKRKHDVTGI